MWIVDIQQIVMGCNYGENVKENEPKNAPLSVDDQNKINVLLKTY